MTYTCCSSVSLLINFVNTDSDDALSLVHRQVITPNNVGLISTGFLWTNFNTFLLDIKIFRFKKIHSKCLLYDASHFVQASICQEVSWRYNVLCWPRVDSRLASSQWETSLQSNAVSHWLGANLESSLSTYSKKFNLPQSSASCHMRPNPPTDSKPWKQKIHIIRHAF